MTQSINKRNTHRIVIERLLINNNIFTVPYSAVHYKVLSISKAKLIKNYQNLTFHEQLKITKNFVMQKLVLKSELVGSFVIFNVRQYDIPQTSPTYWVFTISMCIERNFWPHVEVNSSITEVLQLMFCPVSCL